MPSAEADLEILPLAEADLPSLAGFSCGDDDLDEFLRMDALRLQRESALQTYLAWDARSGDAVLGYVSLLTDAVRLETRERKSLGLLSGDHPVVPAVKIARIGVSVAVQRGRGVGTALVRFAFATALEVNQMVGARLLTLDAYPESIAFYERLGFVRNRAKEYRERNHPSMRLDVFSATPPPWLYPSGEPTGSS